MNIRRSTHVQSIVALSALVTLVGCGASSQGTEREEETGSTQSALTELPPAPTSNWSSTITNDAIITGRDFDGIPEYTCVALYEGGYATGHTEKNWGFCDVGYGGQMEVVTLSQTLQATWGSATNGLYPSNAKPMGGAAMGGNSYSCRVPLEGTMQVGQTGGNLTGCQYPYGGRALTSSSYEVLTQGVSGDESALAYQLTNVQAGAALPYDAVQGGYETDGTIIYPCVGLYGGIAVPGKTEAAWGYCDIPVGNTEVLLRGAAYEVAIPSFTAPTVAGSTVDPFIAGFEANGQLLGVCDAPFNGTVQAGKYNFVTHECSFGQWGSGEVVAPSFTVLGVAIPEPR